MPLTQSALQYWDDFQHPEAAEALNFSHVRDNYDTTIFIEPKNIAWSGPDESELLVNLQQNNGMIRVDMATNQAVAAASYGLKDHNVVPVDINKNDKACLLQTYPNLFAMRNPDRITTLRQNKNSISLRPTKATRRSMKDGKIISRGKISSRILHLACHILKWIKST